MRSYVYMDKDGVKYAVFHRNQSNATWEHPYSERETCGACLGTSTAAPALSTPTKKGVTPEKKEGGE